MRSIRRTLSAHARRAAIGVGAVALLVGGSAASANASDVRVGGLALDVPVLTGDSAALSVEAGTLSVDAAVEPGGVQLSAPAALDTATFPGAFAIAALLPELSPPGANDFSCVPSPEHPDPVVLVHGTFENAYDNWVQLSGDLAADGYCVFALNYGGYAGATTKGVGDIPTSAGELASFVDGVLAATGSDEVDIVGHSQGGMMPRYYIQELGGADEVDQLIGLAPSNYGTTFLGVLPIVAALPGGEQIVGIPCEACVQQRIGSEFLTDLNSGGDTVDGVDYTVISTVFDQVVTPSTNTFLTGPGATNITLQEVCALDATDHLGISYDPIALQLVRNELDPSTAIAPACQVVPPLVS